MQNLETRYFNALMIERFLSDIRFSDTRLSCFDSENTFMRNITIIRKLGSGKNYYGDAYLVCKPNKFYDSLKNLCQVVFSLKTIAPTVSTNEITAMKMFYDDVISGVFPHVPILYGYRRCRDCTFPSAKMLVHKDDGKALQYDTDVTPKEYTVYNGEKIGCNILLTEYAHFGDAEHFFKKNKPSVEITESLLFQLLTSIYYLQSNYCMEHNDIHQGNVLVHSVTEGGVWEYVVNGKSYYCKNYGYLTVLWDFGFAMYPSKDGHKHFPNEFIDADGYVENRTPDKNSDVIRIADMFVYLRKDISVTVAKKVIEIAKGGTYDVDTILSQTYKKYTSVPEEPVSNIFFTSQLQPLEWYNSVGYDKLSGIVDKLPPFIKKGFSIHKQWDSSGLNMFKHSLIDFNMLSCVITNVDVVREYFEWFDVRLLSRTGILTQDMIVQHTGVVDWVALSYFQKLPENIYRDYRSRIVWKYVTDERVKDWKVETLVFLANYLKWDQLSFTNRSVEDIYKLVNYVDWDVLSSKYPVTGHFAIVFRSKLNADLLSLNRDADHTSIYKVAPELVKWDIVFPLSIPQIREHVDKVNWVNISRTIDTKYVSEFKDRIVWKIFWGRPDITLTIVKKYVDNLVERTLVGPFSSVTTKKYEKYIDWKNYDCSSLSDTDLYTNRKKISWTRDTNYKKLLQIKEKTRDKILNSRGFDWESLSHLPLPSNVVEKYTHKIHWNIFCNTGLSADMLLENRHLFSMSDLTNYSEFRIFDYIRFDDINWKNVSMYPDLPKEHVRALHTVLDYNLLSYNDFDWEFIRMNEERVNWSTISRLKHLPEKFIKIYFDNLV